MAVEARVDGSPVIVANVPGSVPSSAQSSGATYIKGDPGPPGPRGPAGPAGQDGADGVDGQDGVSPVISSESIAGGHRLTIVDAEGATTVDVMDGEDGSDGQDGSDGVSPIISSSSITGGHRLTIVDASGTSTVDIMDGVDGQDGQDGASAGFGMPTATIDSNVGTPGVTISASGPDTAKVFAFAFTNLKGQTGATGATGPAGPDADAFTVTLLSASWSSDAQTVSNAYFVASGYAYVVSPSSASFTDYAEAQIYADDVTTTGQMTFHCGSEPSSDLTVNIVRMVAS